MKAVPWKYSVFILALFHSLAVWAEPVPDLLVERSSASRPTLMVLGSAHFGNPGLDNVNVEVDDVLTAERQQQIQALVEKLAAFKPTHIAVEVSYSNGDRLNGFYQEYVRDAAELNRSETHQLGLRLAKMLGHERVYAVDWQGAPPGGYTDDFDWHKYGLANGQAERIAALSSPEIIGTYMQQGTRSITEWIKAINSADGLLAFHRQYFDVALVGSGEHSPGANWVGHWHTRNLMIFNNLVRLGRDTDDRVLVIYGASHAYPLRQFAIESGAFTVVDVGEVL